MPDNGVPVPFRCLTALVLLATGLQSHAGPWELTPRITLAETLTDNVRLTPSGFKNSELITILTPGITVERQSKRLDLSLNYQLQGIFYKNNSGDNDVINLLDATGTGEFLQDRFFVDVSAASSEQNVRNSGRIALDNTSLTDDRSRVFTYRVNPYWRERIGNIMDAELSYQRNSVESSRSLDSDADIVRFNLSSSTAFTRLLWDLDLSNEKIDYQAANSTRFRNATLETEYLISTKLAFKAVVGYDDNQFSSNNRDIDGTLWRLGGVWRLSRRTSVEVTAGERFFGTDIFVDVSHRTRKTQWLFTFSRRPDTTRSTLFEQQVFPLNDIFGAPILNPDTSNPATLNVNVPVQSAEVQIRKIFNGAFNYTHRKNTLNLTIFSENREFQISGRKEDSYGANLGWTWNVNRQTVSNLQLAYSTNDSLGGRNQDFMVIDYRLTRTITPELDVSLGYRYTDVTSNLAGDSYTENRVFANISKRF